MLLVHGAHVLLPHAKWLQKYADDDAALVKDPLSLLVTPLAVQAKRQTLLVSRCTSNEISPELFLEILNRPDDGTQPSKDEQRFRNEIVPDTLVELVHDSYVAVISEDHGAGRWFQHIPTLYERSVRSKVDAALLMRFFRPESYLDITGIDWQTASKKDQQSKQDLPLKWKVSHKQLFLKRHLPAIAWAIDWEEPTPPENYGAQFQARAVERRSALARPEELDAETQKQWQSEWLNELGKVAHLKELYRFLRVRLLELMEEPILAESEEEQLVIAMILLEYGSHYDLNRLMTQLFPFDNDGRLQPPPNLCRQRVRLQALHAMRRYVGVTKAALSARTEPRPPRDALLERGRLRLVEETLWRIGNAVSMTDDATQELISALSASYHSDDGPSTAGRRLIHGRLEITDKERSIVWQEETNEPNAWMLRSLICNRSLFSVSAVVAERETGHYLNLFECGVTGIREFESRGKNGEVHKVLATILGETGEGASHKYRLNCGLRRPILAFMPRQYRAGEAVQTGDLVGASIQWMEGPRYTGWIVAGSLDTFQPKRIVGSIELVTIEEDPVNRLLDLKSQHGRVSLPFERDLWDPDLSRFFVERASGKVRAVFEQQRWRPLDHEYTEFLLDAWKSGCSVAVATFANREYLPDDGIIYRFSLGIGQNYLVPASRIVDEDRSAIDEKLDALEDPRGLLVALTTKVEQGSVRVGLWHEELTLDSELLHNRYPALLVPFDDRNIRWRDLDSHFEDHPAEAIASRNGHNWHVDLDGYVPKPFPAQIEVTMTQSIKEQLVQFRIKKWEPHTGHLVADPVAYLKLTVPQKTRAAFIEEWIELKKKAPVTIVQVYRRQQSELDVLKCRTSHNIEIMVEAESLTMRLDQQNALSNMSPRMAYVVYIGQKTESIHADQIEKLETVDSAEGVLAGVPVNATLCDVWWRVGGSVVEGKLQIPDLRSLGLSLGTIVNARKKNHGWEITFEKRWVRARACWQFRELSSYDDYDSLWYLGRANYQGKPYFLAEGNAGELVNLPKSVTACHLAPGMGQSFSGGIRADQKAIDVSRERYFSERLDSVRTRRSVLKFSEGKLPGICAYQTPRTGVCLRIDIIPEFEWEDENGQYYTVRRRFTISGAAPAQHAIQIPEEETRLRAALDSYFSNPGDLDCVPRKIQPKDGSRPSYSVDLNDLSIPNPDVSGSWTNVVQIAPFEGPWLEHASYPASGKVRLIRMEDRILGSFRTVEILDIANYRAETLGIEGYGANADTPLNEHVPLKEQPLYYAGRDPDKPGHHRFEWGYGRILSAHESRLRFDGNEFRTARGILFPGDSITAVKFTELPADPCLEILQVNLSFSNATLLYRQRERFKIVHLLKLDRQLRISSVVGFSDLNEDVREFERISRAQFGPESQEHLRNALSEENAWDEFGTMTVLGRLDENKFFDSFGEELVFHHVVMGFSSSESSDYLQSGEAIFMRAGIIVQKGNETLLELEKYPKLRPADVSPGKIWKECRVPRRRFSVREDLLPRLRRRLRDKSIDHVYLVRLRKEGDGINTSLIAHMPDRSLGALRAAMEEEGGSVLAMVKSQDMQGLRVELQPGIFFRLPAEGLSAPPGTLEKGACIRIERPASASGIADSFQVTVAAFSDARYVPETGRPAVGVPKNLLLHERVPQNPSIHTPEFWEGEAGARKRCFTIEGLPGIEAVPGTFTPDRHLQWGKPRAADFISIMTSQHPDRYVYLSRDEFGDFRVAPLRDRCKVGRIGFGAQPIFVPMRPADIGDSRPLEWTRLSFKDTSAKDLQNRCKTLFWECHDAEMGWWNQEEEVARRRTEPESAVTGPTFFESEENRLSLRYSRDNFFTFGFPVRELVDYLAKSHGSGQFPVAAPSADGGLWIELAPGRIVELPGQLVVRDVGSGNHSLMNFHWQAFAPGDEISLSLASDDAFRPDRVTLLKWKPGSRGAFADARCFLPIAAHDPVEGRLELGAGQFVLQLPVRTAFSGKVVKLLPDNTCIDGHDALPSRDDVVLLGLDGETPVVLGFPNLLPYPEGNRVEVWIDDPLASDLRGSDLGNVIRAVGGAIPITVEMIVVRNRLLYFSRRRQRAGSTIPPGAIAQASILGGYGNDRTVLLRCGSGIIKASMSAIVHGLPVELDAMVLDALKDQTIWVSAPREGTSLCFGLGTERMEEFAVAPIRAIVNVDGPNPGGLICAGPENPFLLLATCRPACMDSVESRGPA